MNYPIDNIELFKKHMNQLGYQEESNRFLSKHFTDLDNYKIAYDINISIDNEKLTAITGYDSHNKVIDIPKDILKMIKNDIKHSL